MPLFLVKQNMKIEWENKLEWTEWSERVDNSLAEGWFMGCNCAPIKHH